ARAGDPGGGTYEDYARALTRGDPVRRLGMDTWFFWTAGNQAFWGRAFPVATRGEVDALRLLDARTVRRADRFAVLGTINDPGCRAPSGPDEFGFLLDLCTEPQDPQQKLLYGEPTGVIGMRKFPNPRFDRDRWFQAGGAVRYLSQTRENFDPTLEPPYLIGLSCAVCHVAFDPLRPPADTAEPAWANLAPTIGNQYLRESVLFTLRSSPREFRWHAGQAQPLGTSDTSRITNDFINNPTTINAVFGLPARLAIRTYEVVSSDQAAFIRGMVEPIPRDLLNTSPPQMLTAHGLMDGADSVGLALAALRVYCNIGGIDYPRFLASLPTADNDYTQQPFDIAAAKANPNGLWVATEPRMPALQAFLASIEPPRLARAPGGGRFLSDPPALVHRGKIVFARHCAHCHSSKHPDPNIQNPDERRRAYERLVLAPDFLDDNFLSDDRRYPLPQIRTNAARALATNALEGEIWQSFSSETYKGLPPAGRLQRLFNPLAPSRPISFELPAGGRGYYRTSSLIGMWATAPYLHNNALGFTTLDPSVEGRMQAFDGGVRKLLWPRQRLGRASVQRTISSSILTDPLGEPILVPLPDGRRIPFEVPAGTPINLLANLHPRDLPAVIAAYARGGPQAALAEALRRNLSPDFVEDHGHEFGTELPDRDKWALIAFLKRL
ncbi:MAG: hypothetical protein IRY99_22035, partial [Isosphaeraceae bacterium]|nr:hypothetical protein [Isosphaeraceae bacterium]